MDNNVYISSGKKILRHLDILKKFQKEKIITPISLQIAPTSRCNLNCCFCSNANRTKHEDLPIRDILDFIDSLNPLTVEWTGGGDPSLYSDIRKAIYFCRVKGLKQGFITNGISLVDKIQKDIKYLDWIRISLNSLDYVDEVVIPINYIGTLGFSYVLNEKTKTETLEKIKLYVKKYNPKYVRIVPNCQTSSEDLKEKNSYFSKIISSWGAPYFYQSKEFDVPKRCWWGWFKPFLLHDGYIYPCSSVVLNSASDRSFNKKYRWHTMKSFLDSIKNMVYHYDCKNCDSCVFGEQNSLIEALINPEMEDFI